MEASDACGLVVMATSSASVTIFYYCIVRCHEWGLPLHALLSACCCLLGAAEGAVLIRTGGIHSIGLGQVRFLHVRGLLGAAFTPLLDMTILLGMPFGDVLALSSVVQAMLVFSIKAVSGGRMHAWHWVAFAATLCGAAMIVAHLLQSADAARDLVQTWTGIVVSMMLGTIWSAIAAITRLLRGVDNLVITVFLNAHGCLLNAVIEFTTGVEHPAAVVLRDPTRTKRAWVLLFTSMAIGQLLMITGAKMAPGFFTTVMLAPFSICLAYASQVYATERQLGGVLNYTGILLILTGLVLLSTAGGSTEGPGEVEVQSIAQIEEARTAKPGAGDVAGCACADEAPACSAIGASSGKENDVKRGAYRAHGAPYSRGEGDSLAEFLTAEFSGNVRKRRGHGGPATFAGEGGC